MTSNQEHWGGLADLVDKGLKIRVEALSSNPKKRSKLTAMFAYQIAFAPLYIREIGKKGAKESTLKMLRSFGAPNEVLKLNTANCGEGEWATLEDAIGESFGWLSGEIVSCVPGRLLFHESEEPAQRAVIYKVH